MTHNDNTVVCIPYSRDRKSIRRWIKTLRSGRFESGACQNAQNDCSHRFGIHLLLDAILHHYASVRYIFKCDFILKNFFFSRFISDKEYFQKIDQQVQNTLFIFACINSVMDPIVYGYFNLRNKNNRNQVRYFVECIMGKVITAIHVIIIRIWHQLCRALGHEWIHPWREVIVGLKQSELQPRHPTQLSNSKYNNSCIFDLLYLHSVSVFDSSLLYTHWEYKPRIHFLHHFFSLFLAL